jgi:hypothetical protein
MATIANNAVARASAERRFYSWMAIALVAVVFLGFGPSFYLRNVVPAYPRPNPSLTPFVILHGSIFTLWMVVLIAQTQLVAAGRRDMHIKLGMAGMALAVAMLPVMYLAAVWQVARANQPPFTDPLNWTAVPLSTVPAFAFLVWQGWAHRRNGQWHKRLMLSAAILIVLGPAIGRLPIAPPTLTGHTVQVGIGLALFVPLFLWDRRSQGKIHPATRLGLLTALIAYLVPIVLMATESWAPIARHLPGVSV